jgi:predicted nucleotidyltransferase
MKICAIICELNPFHNGHKYLIEQAKKLSGCDRLLLIMSGHFTQRGDISILDKFTRAKHAILGGADCVIELPAPFAVAPAEIFARGAVKILSSIPEVTHLCFGCESATKEQLIQSAKLMIDDGGIFNQLLMESLAGGESYALACQKALFAVGGTPELLDCSNNILALEYTKAIIASGSKLQIVPVKRTGAGYKDGNLIEGFSSASAIRGNLGNSKLQSAVPKFVYDDLPKDENLRLRFEDLQRFALLNNYKSDIAAVYGCTEGLENKLKELCNLSYDKMIEEATTKRYTSSRIRRICCANLLKLYMEDTERFLQNDLYIKPLAVKKECTDQMLATLSKSNYPTVILQRQLNNLTQCALQCFKASDYADEVYNFIANKNICNYTILKV